jgi:predicted S18 family serine protease
MSGVSNRNLWIFSGLLLILILADSYYIYNLNNQISQLADAVKEVSRTEGFAAQNEDSKISFTLAEKHLPIVAISSRETGLVENMTLRLIPGSNDILINTNPFLEPDLQFAVKTAVSYAISRSPGYQFDKDFVFNFGPTEAQLIGGESAGAAAALLAIATLENKDLKTDVVITGTVSGDGTIGEIGGVLEKAKAVADAGYKFFLVPVGQSKITYYERQVQRQSTDFGFDILKSRYVPKTLNLSKAAKDEWGLNVIEVSTIEDAIPYFVAD